MKHMILEINSKKTELTPEQIDWIKNRLRFALSRFNGAVSTVSVKFDDVNGPKGGIDKQCLITVKCKTVGDVIIKSEGSDYLSAIKNSVDRLQRTISRNLKRRRDTPIRMNRRKTKVEEDVL